VPLQTRRPSTTIQPVEHGVSSCEAVGNAGLCGAGLVRSVRAHPPSAARPTITLPNRMLRADRLTLLMGRSVEEGASYVRYLESTDGYAE